MSATKATCWRRGGAWRSVSTGGQHAAGHTCGIEKVDGSLWCWGSNGSGQLGNGGTDARRTPGAINTNEWLAIDTGEKHTCAIKADQTLWCWGLGQLGQGTITNKVTNPQQVQSARNWHTVSAGQYHPCAVDDDNSLWCWGDASQAAVGNGDPSVYTLVDPMEIGTSSSWSSVSAATAATFGIADDGSLWSWGRNDEGQLGHDGLWRAQPQAIGD